jgi:hypothetical protein
MKLIGAPNMLLAWCAPLAVGLGITYALRKAQRVRRAVTVRTVALGGVPALAPADDNRQPQQAVLGR